MHLGDFAKSMQSGGDDNGTLKFLACSEGANRTPNAPKNESTSYYPDFHVNVENSCATNLQTSN